MKFTYGFEIEGIMSEKVGQKIVETFGITSQSFNKHFHQDGSVRTRPKVGFKAFSSHEQRCNCGSCTSYATEYSSPVFSTSNALLKNLALFEEGKHHLWDTSCGLHLNIGVQGLNHKQLFALASNMTLLKEIRKEAMNMCKCQRNRLKRPTQFYVWYKNGKNLLEGMRAGDKYRFVRFHPKGYLEFRFLSPCEHKVKNVTKVVQILTSYLQKNLKSRFVISIPEREADEVVRITKSFKIPKKETYNPSLQPSIKDKNCSPHFVNVKYNSWGTHGPLFRLGTHNPLTSFEMAQVANRISSYLQHNYGNLTRFNKRDWIIIESETRGAVFSECGVSDIPTSASSGFRIMKPPLFLEAPWENTDSIIFLGTDEKPKKKVPVRFDEEVEINTWGDISFTSPL